MTTSGEPPVPDAAPTPGAEETAARLTAWAREAGFDAVGIAGVEPLERGAAFVAWLERGEQADMDYLERRVEERLEPEKILPGARSVLCVGLQYHPLAGEEPVEGDLWPRVARYARGRDYHNLMGKRLKKLAKRIRREFPGADTRPYVDTGPVLERELAARAGLGVPGKNTNLLSRQLGSWFLLGEIFTTLEAAPSRPAPAAGAAVGDGAEAGGGDGLTDLCGRCTLCLEACPTDAFPEPYRLDANRCISYWTIEHRGAMPEEMRSAIGDWVFGCDVCQEVCPWNLRYEGRADRGGRTPADHPDLHLPDHRRELDLVAVLRLERDDYEERFRGSAMKRARLEGLKRNAAVVMGNRGDAGYAVALAGALADEDDPVVRGHSAWALGRIGGEEARSALAGALGEEADPEVRREITSALVSVEGEGAEPA